jgi:pimeloyl-ACP methyl ester carboxylesterase
MLRPRLPRWLKRIVIGCCAELAMTLMAGSVYQWLAIRRDLAATAPPGRLVDVGEHRLHIWCTGSGSPPVILDSGLGGSFVDWGYVQPEVARFAAVCSYDRAGMGYSDTGPFPRTALQNARELGLLLDRADILQPVILVGASLGGFTIRVLASQEPNRVAGVVLVDASHEDQQAEIPAIARVVPLLTMSGALRIAGLSFGQPLGSLAPHVREPARVVGFRTSNNRAAASELLSIETSKSQVRSTRRKLSIPVIVLTAGRNTDRVWQRLQKDQVALSDAGCHIVAAGSGHVIPLSQPQTVVRAIQSIVAAVRFKDTRNACASVS